MRPDEFLQSIEDFLTEMGMSATTFGLKALNDPNFVFDIRDGRSPSLDVALRVEQFMRQRREARQAMQEAV